MYAFFLSVKDLICFLLLFFQKKDKKQSNSLICCATQKDWQVFALSLLNKTDVNERKMFLIFNEGHFSFMDTFWAC